MESKKAYVIVKYRYDYEENITVFLDYEKAEIYAKEQYIKQNNVEQKDPEFRYKFIIDELDLLG